MRTMCLVVKWTADAVGLVQLVYLCTFCNSIYHFWLHRCTFSNIIPFYCLTNSPITQFARAPATHELVHVFSHQLKNILKIGSCLIFK